MTNDYTELRRQLRAFHGEDIHICTNAERLEMTVRGSERIKAYAKEHPSCDALDLRREAYDFMAENYQPVVFTESPFYFENGGYGGWNRTAVGQVVASCMKERLLQNREFSNALHLFQSRGSLFYACTGPFYDDRHNNSAVFRLLNTGFKGIYEEALCTREKCQTPYERKWLETAIHGLEVIRHISGLYAEKAKQMLPSTANVRERHFMQMMVEAASVTPWEPPRTFYEALNLCGFFREVFPEIDGVRVNTLGRPDAWIQKFYEADLAAGRLTHEEAFDLICRFLLMGDQAYNRDYEVDMIISHENEHTLTLGGCDAEGHEVFNELTRMFLKAYREQNLIYPKFFCRFSRSSSEEYLNLIGEDVFSGRGVYSLLNDDSLIPALTATGHTLEDARNYCCSGCWDISVACCEDNEGSNFFNLARIVETTIHYSDEQLERCQFKPRRLEGAQSFGEVYEAIMGNAKEIFRYYLQAQHDYGGCQAMLSPSPAYSAAFFDCLEKRRDFGDGGLRYYPHAVSLGAFANFVDSLLAIQAICFEERCCSLPELLAAVRNNWEGAEELRERVLKTPHWGDNQLQTCKLAKRIVDEFAAIADEIPNAHGGHYQLAMWLYREFKRWGNAMKATPDGRHTGDELSQSVNASHFRVHEPLTTVLQNYSCLNLRRFAGNSVVNLCVERENFTPETLVALLRSFAALDLQQLQLNCMSSQDLEEARIHPEKHQNLIVRICGFSAKFVALCPEWQQEVINRRKF
ncbi:MAG: hypothetical protein IKP00_15685 [Victivallales bacterium]|nr:hypothetical protein [Victivallales bacterium]